MARINQKLARNKALELGILRKNNRKLQAELATYKAGNVPVTQIIADNEGLAIDLEAFEEENESLKKKNKFLIEACEAVMQSCGKSLYPTVYDKIEQALKENK